MITPSKNLSVLFLLFLFSVLGSVQAQNKYQSLLWEISGNGMNKPSYLYGTMHVSNKIAFRLGSPFFEALESVDVVALELEPELWFDEVLGGDLMTSAMGMNSEYGFDYGYGGNRSWNELSSKFKIDQNITPRMQEIFKENPAMLNQLLFRFSDMSGNFEESPWLDMYIYQSAKKLKKKTMGLETFQESMNMQMQSMQDRELNESESYSYEDELSYEDRMSIGQKVEEAYRNGDLDLLDSLTKRISEPSFLKYILIERNKNFIKGLDTLLKQQPIFAAMGAAHLPGDEGCIEMLRALGYTVTPINMGKRDGKQKKKLEEMYIKRSLETYLSPDGVIGFDTPYHTYALSFEKGNSSYLSMDIANGLTFIVNRMMTHSGFDGNTPQYYLDRLENALYETIPGEIVYSKKISNNGISGLEILNRTRRGDIHKSQVFFLDNEIVIARLAASGEKIKNGAGDHFFSTFKINSGPENQWYSKGLSDQSILYNVPGRVICYTVNDTGAPDQNIYLESQTKEGDVFGIYRMQAKDKGYLDEDAYELYKLEDAFRSDFKLTVVDSVVTNTDQEHSLTYTYEPQNGKTLRAYFRISALGYHVFYALTNTEKSATDFFASISLKNPVYEKFYEHTDSLLFFKTKIPWETKENDFNSLVNMFGGYGNRKKKNDPTQNYSKSKTYSPPTSTEWIRVSYLRKGKYFFNKDKETFEEENDLELSREGDLVIDKKEFVWEGDNYKAHYWMSDTLTQRAYHIYEILQNRGFYTVKVTYDKRLGESDYAKTFLENFEPLDDTLSSTSYFATTKEDYLKDILSSDSTAYEFANEEVSNLYYIFSSDERSEIYTKINETPPPLATEEDLKVFNTKLSYYSYKDASKENVQRLITLYAENEDSALYQQILLENLLKMKTQESFKAAKELLLKNTPIGNDIDAADLADRLLDSMELGKLFYPEILDLTSYEEYKYCWINALSEMLDSGKVQKEVYKSFVPYLIREAKVEFKRFSSTTETKEKGYKYSSSYTPPKTFKDNAIYTYWNLLYPYRSQVDIKELFDLAESATKKNVVEAYAYFKVEKGESITDAACNLLLEKDKDRENYILLKDLNRLDLLPDTFDLERTIIEGELKNSGSSYEYNKSTIDSVVFLTKYETSIRSRSYNVYHYKYAKTSNDKQKWYVMVIFVKEGSFEEGKYRFLSEKELLDEKDPEGKQFDRLRKTIVNENRQNHYGSNSYSNNYQNSDYDFLMDLGL